MTDALLKSDFTDLDMANGDFNIGESDLQNGLLIIRFHKGNLKSSPLTGVGEKRLLNGTVDGAFRREIQLQLEADGYRLKTLNLTPEKIDIDFQ